MSALRADQRRVARRSLYGSLLITGAVAATLVPWMLGTLEAMVDLSWSEIDYAAMPEVERLQRLVQIDTTSATGSEIEAARYLAGELEAAGIDVHVEALGERHANLWAILEGEDPQALVLQSHLDTNEVDLSQDWRHPPFSGAIDGPWLWGRGTFDMKSVTIAQLEAMLALERTSNALGRRPRRSLILLATSSEEVGSDLGSQWIIERHPELVSRFWAVLTEGGVIEAISREEIKYWGTSFAAKSYVEVLACSASRDRLAILARDLAVHGHDWRLRITDEVRAFLAFYVGTRTDPYLNELLADPDRTIRSQRRFGDLPYYLRALFRNEVHLFPIEGYEADGGYRLPIMLHLLPGEELDEELIERLLPASLTHGVRLTVRPIRDTAEGSPLDHPVPLAIDRLLETRFQTKAVGPYVLSAFTNDGSFFRAAGVPAYGFTPFLSLSADAGSTMGPLERITLPAYVEGVEIYRELVQRLAGPVQPAVP
ncbi:MAG TPA: M20/M25/M40 family metallo-hydrolase [Thermoanaerobaculia bacterium]|nr:M20/M25/M40 family metallo-hydrolase [Thermoanaerobaculia bacterium]